jgi:anti-sigma regulatory factor (Ser/Thr protein kinase)
MTARGETSSRERRLVLRNDLTELDRLGVFVRGVGHDEGLAPDRLFALELCLEEAVANIIMHGGPADHGAMHVAVTITRDESSLMVRLEDDGAPFDPTAVPPPATAASLEEAKIGGLGVHLIRELATDMRYDRVGERNRLTLIFATRPDRPA